METKNKLVKIAKISYIISKVLYCLSILACLVFIVLAITLPNSKAIKTCTPAETAMIFSTLALYSFMITGLLWNVEGIFKSVVKEQTPFNDSVGHYLKKTAIFLILVDTVPAMVGSILIKIIYPGTELTFPVEIGGVFAGLAMLIFSVYFKYGKELQNKDDETL